MSSSPARGPLSAFRLGVSHAGSSSDYASLGVSPRRQSRRPAVADEGVRHCEDVPLPSWSVSPQRTLSPSSHHRRGGLSLTVSAIAESGPPPSLAANNLSFSSPLTPSANGALVHLPSTAFEDPHSWSREHAQLRGRFLRPSDAVTLYHDHAAALNSRATMRHVCVVHPLPRLDRVQEALRRRCVAQTAVSAYDAFEQRCSFSCVDEETASVALLGNAGESAQRGAHREQRNEALVPAARTWCVSGSTYDNEIVVCDTSSGQRLMRVVDSKMKVAVTALQHAPFRGFMETQQLHVLPVREPQDVLRLKASQLVFTDYVWCGLQDGTLRLFPACHQHIRASGPSPPYSKSPSADLVYELPRYQGGAIVSIVCSPCHDTCVEDECKDSGDADAEEPFAQVPNRVSEAVRRMTAAAAGSASGNSDGARRHLSLVCTASSDATVVIWDVRKVYEAVAQARQQQRRDAGKGEQRCLISPMPRHGSHGGTHVAPLSTNSTASTTATLCSDVITFDCSSPLPGVQNMVVRSSCTLVQVRPLAKLSGGFAGLTALRWVSSLVCAGSVHGDAGAVERDVRSDTRIPQIAPSPASTSTAAARTLAQTQTRFDKREGERAELELTEEEMQGMERELAHMLPPLAPEPPQALRVNLLVASDCLGSVHVWNLDEELHRHGDGAVSTAFGWPTDFPASAHASMRSTSSCSEGRSSASNAVETSPLATPTRRSTKRKSGGLSTRDSGGSSSHRKAERSGRSRRGVGGLGLAEARENRARMSELTSTGTTSAVPSRASQQRSSPGRGSCEEKSGHFAGVPLHEARRPSTGDATPCLTPPRKSHETSHLLRTRKDANVLGAGAAATSTAPTKKIKKTRNSVQETSPSLLRASLHGGTSPSRGSLQRPGASCGRAADGSQPVSNVRPRGSLQRGTSVSLGNPHSAAQDLTMPAQPSKCQFRLAGGGAAITDMVVDLPHYIHTTLRRIRNPSRVTASWQHRPTEAEMDARVLENEFDELTEEKALFFAFAQLQLYVGVDGGAVSNVRCAPEWALPDSDGREFFKAAANAAIAQQVEASGAAAAALSSVSRVHGSEWMREVPLSESVQLDAFQLHLRRSLLDVHVQPLTHLFLDAWQGRLWVARQDGFVSVLSTRDNQLIARMAHPSSDALLPPPTVAEWAKLQAQFAARVAEEGNGAGSGGVMGFGLECHKECRGLPPNHVTEVLPIATRRQRALIVFTAAATADVTSGMVSEGGSGGFRRRLSLTSDLHQDVTSPLKIAVPASNTSASGRSVRSAATASSTGARLAATATVDSLTATSSSAAPAAATLLGVEGQSDVKAEFRARCGRQWRWLQELQLCRLDAFAACQTQRQRYYALCDGIGRNVRHVITELGDYATLTTLRTHFQAWKDHRVLFQHTHTMRHQRTARLQREQPLARQLASVCATQLRGAYLVRWMQWVAERRRMRHDMALSRFAAAALPSSEGTAHAPTTVIVASPHRRHARPLPTPAMMERLHLLTSGGRYFERWQAWTAEAAATRRATTAIMQRFQQQQQQTRASAVAAEWAAGCQAVATAPLRRTASSPVSTPPRRQRPAPRGVADGEEDMVTPCRPPISGACEAYAATLSWSAGERRHPEEALPLPLPQTPAQHQWCGVGAGADALPHLPPSVEPFMTAMADLLRARVYVFHFSDARSSTTSVLDESWTVILENAESGAEGDSDDDRRFSVFRFALLPLLQGLLSTADDVLPNLFDNSVAEEVLSMLVGIVLAMDYVTANAENTLWLTEAVGSPSGGGTGGMHLLNTVDAALAVLRVYAVRAFRADAEAAEVLRGLAKSRRVLAQFLDFAMERAVMRRIERV